MPTGLCWFTCHSCNLIPGVAFTQLLPGWFASDTFTQGEVFVAIPTKEIPTRIMTVFGCGWQRKLTNRKTASAG